MKRDTKPPLNFRFHGELDVKQLIDICIEVQRPKAEKAIADELALAEKAAECPKICINEQNECPKICIGGLETDFMPKYKVSILGDSISTYIGYNPRGYAVYYKDDKAYDNEINSVNDTWWKQVIDGLGGELCVNNSYSGSLVTGAFAPSACSAERCASLHDETVPDIILIYMGTNDRGFEMNLGENRPNDTMGFYGAYRAMLRQIKNNYPTAKIVCGTLLMGRLQAGQNLAYDRFMKEDMRYNGVIIISYQKKDCANLHNDTDYIYEKNTDGKKITTVTRADSDWQKPVVEIRQFNNMELLISKTEDWQNISDTVKVKTETLYDYDENNNLIKETSTKFIDKAETVTEIKSIINYSYNAQGGLILTESYMEGEELSSGKNYKQNVYDKNGHIVKTLSWNSLDSSSKFYEESDRAGNGQIIADRDETGEISAEYDYIASSNTVNSVKYSNGSKFAYGRNPNNDTVTSITQSTENGEENTTDIVHEYGMPVKVKSGNTVIDYTYDGKGRKKSVIINGVLQSEYSYEDFKQDGPDDRRYEKNTCVLNVDGNAIRSIYLKEGSLDDDVRRYDVRESLSVNKERLYYKYYDIDGIFKYVTYKTFDEGEAVVNYEYDSYHNLIKAVTTSGGTETFAENYVYNNYSEMTEKSYSGSVNQTYTYTYKDNAARELDYISFSDYKFKPLSDVNGRNTGREILSGDNKIAAEYITYRKVGDHATNMPATVWFGSGANIKDSIKYKYDRNGNICEISENGHIIAKYAYDSLNRLVREDNKQIGKTILYNYDNNGNITERCEYEYTLKSSEDLADIKCEHYSYDYDGDKLIKIISDSGEEEFAYNSIGNPTLYRDKEIEWQYGARLVNFNGTTFAYDGLGRRAKKDDIEFIYDNDGKLIAQSNGLEFVYDNSGVVGVKYKEEQYFYRKDAQGNIIAILDSNGDIVVRYINEVG